MERPGNGVYGWLVGTKSLLVLEPAAAETGSRMAIAAHTIAHEWLGVFVL